MEEIYYTLKDGSLMPRIGIGSWHIGENVKFYEQEKEALKTALDLGVRLIDTAEYYSDGKAESLIGDVIKDYNRSDLFIVSKVLPQNAGYENFFKSLESSLNRLSTSYLDLYLLHWKGSIPLHETIRCFKKAQDMGLIRNWGVSNFDTSDMEKLYKIDGGKQCSVNQCLYNLVSRGIEYDLLPNLIQNHIGFMAYCPLGDGGKLTEKLINDEIVCSIAKKYNISPYSVLLSFTLRNPNVISIFKSSSKQHMIENLKGLQINISEEDFKLLDERYPSPKKRTYLDVK